MHDGLLERHGVDGQGQGAGHLLDVPAAPRCWMWPQEWSASLGEWSPHPKISMTVSRRRIVTLKPSPPYARIIIITGGN